eukprot:6828976-Lingulodinium_polyedra.AAC.1
MGSVPRAWRHWQTAQHTTEERGPSGQCPAAGRELRDGRAGCRGPGGPGRQREERPRSETSFGPLPRRRAWA